ncbi:DUF29 domain-containing protein [Waterburya agarophytonicola K14]|uniref:DUF29 domain-containing protein n=1 Tax=Waterburya agarophytonicola KI4 TaxID=2874699 RepID=A0A964BM58_9CYAN|nr:DUF29 domain-containing protein [Waterburya agarophytonicola]MCC0175629.1 DUF29 domain-containing protein [Waterburya agarophytonicola KI4]
MTNLKQLHDRDFNLWIEKTKEAIQNRDFANMDWDNLLDEIDDMGKSEKRSLDSYMQRLIEHILKLRYWDEEVERCRKSWQQEVVNFRNRINRILKKNPSLKNYLKSEYSDIYQDAISTMRFDFEIPEDDIVEVEQIMKDGYFG